MKYIVGAYATAPSLGELPMSDEDEFYSHLKLSIPDMRGLEIPFWGESIHQYGDEYLQKIIQGDWQNVLSCIPGTMNALAKNPKFGLASDDAAGRAAAIQMHKKANQVVHRLNELFGDKSIIAIQVTSAPSIGVEGVSASKSAFIKSLDEILSWDWFGAKIVAEHCDAYTNTKPYEKGFLSLEAEIDAIAMLHKKQNVGITINWGRSAIEGRNALTAIDHIRAAYNKGILSGLIFSGASDQDSEYGLWKDTHVPFNLSSGVKHYEMSSLLTKENIIKSFGVLSVDDLDYVGIKLLSMPISESTIKRRVGINCDAITILNNILM